MFCFTSNYTCAAFMINLCMSYRVTVVGCACVCVRFDFPNSNESAKKTYGLPQHCSCLTYNVGFS